jgi:hypothetical protein
LTCGRALADAINQTLVDWMVDLSGAARLGTPRIRLTAAPIHDVAAPGAQCSRATGEAKRRRWEAAFLVNAITPSSRIEVSILVRTGHAPLLDGAARFVPAPPLKQPSRTVA